MTPEIGDRVCDLECLKTPTKSNPKPTGVTEFIGPVKIVLVETPESEYCRRQWVASLIHAAYYMMGAINITMMYYTLIWWKTIQTHAHVLLCTGSMTYLIPTAVLFYNTLSGTGGALKTEHRARAHWQLQCASCLFLIGGAFSATHEKELNFDHIHTFTSFVAVSCVVSNLLLGIVHYFILPLRLLRCIHRWCGVATMCACAASFITGVLDIGPVFTFKLPFYVPFFTGLMGIRYVVSFFCVLFHLFSAEAILALNYVNFWAITLQSRHRIMVHIILQVLALVCGCVGTTLITFEKGLSASVHGISSMIAVGLALLSLVLGPCALTLSTYYCRSIHVTFGALTFLASSVSVSSGITAPSFTEAFAPASIHILIGFIVFYTAFIVISTFIKCTTRL